MVDTAVTPDAVVVLIGDDLTAAQELLRAMPATPGFSVVVAVGAQDSVAALKLSSAMPVIDVRAETQIHPDRVYALPPGMQSVLSRGMITVKDHDGPGHVDRLLRSVADSFGRDSTIVVLGGREVDGALGIKRVREAGGLTICQRIEQGPLAELPRAAVMTGLVDLVLRMEEIPARLLQKIDRIAASDEIADESRVAETLREILVMIRVRTGHDFTWYKRATLYRRLARRMQVCQTETISDYHRLLREQPTELTNLLRDFLISVTNFFRDSESFDALAQTVVPRLFEGKSGGDQVRVWVAGCATGEEAYSIAILLAEYAATLPDPPELQVFATDIDEEALHEARAGIYPEQIAVDVTRARLDRFFSRESGGYRVNKDIREMMLFSPHNVLRDPPFSRLDLVSCRNVLIYLNRDAQERVINTFHFALRSEGFLFLGSSESAEGVQQFSPFDAKNRIFQRRLAPTVFTNESAPSGSWVSKRPLLTVPAGVRAPVATFGELHQRAVEQYAPPSVLVNEELDVVHVSEHAGQFLTVAGGEPTRQLLRMVHPALRYELRGAVYVARQTHRGRDTRIVRFDDDGKARTVEMRVRTVLIPEAGRGALLVMFDELDTVERPTPTTNELGDTVEPVVREMEEDLHRTRDQLRTTVEQYETSLEELKASNEELHAINEELRSATEELETSKEELQSVNEELTTLNHELKAKIDEVSRTNSDLQNLMTSTDIGVLFLDRQLNIKRYTPRVQDLFNIIGSDLGRPLSHLTHHLDYKDLPHAAAQALLDLRTTEREVRSADGRRFLVRILPYRSMDDRIEGVVLTFVDVTDLKNAQEARVVSEAALRTSEERLAVALAAAPLAVITHDATLATTWAFMRGQRVNTSEVGETFSPEDSTRYDKIVREVYASGQPQRIELSVVAPSGTRCYDFRIEPRREGALVTGVTSVGFDITPSKLAESKLRENDRHKDEFLAMLSHELRNPLTPLRVAFDVARLASTNPSQLANAFGIMDRQIQVLVRLVDDLLDLSRIAQGKIALLQTPLDASRIVEAALDATRPLVDEHHHRIKLALPSDPMRIVGDFTRLSQVLTNLLTNAAKYTPDGGEIEVSLTPNVRDNRLAISVRDNGIGIAAEVLPRIFDIFVQADEMGERRRAGGLGIGLNLVRRIVELHGGSVHAASDGPGHGSIFTIYLPLAGPEL